MIITRMHRPLWTYRPLLCLLGLHDTRVRPAATWVKIGDLHHSAYRIMTVCRRCDYSRQSGEAVIVRALNPWKLPRV